MRASVIALFLSTLIAGAAAAATYTVEADGGGDYPDIQAAVDAAVEEDDVVLLGDGVYTGAGNRDIVLHEKRIILRSASGDPALCVIDAAGSAADPHRVFQIFITGEKGARDFRTRIHGITLTGAHGLSAVTIMDGAMVVFDNCVFRGNRVSTSGAAILIVDSSPLTVTNCVFADNHADDAGGAIDIWSYGELILENVLFHFNTAATRGACVNAWGHVSVAAANCSFVNNESPAGAAAMLLGVGDKTLETCIFFGNVGQSVLRLENGVLVCCDSYGNAAGDWIGDMAPFAGADGNLCEDPLFCDWGAGDYHLYDVSPCAPENNVCGALIGALPVGCEMVSTEAATWSSVKALY